VGRQHQAISVIAAGIARHATGTHMSIILQWLQQLLKLRHGQSHSKELRHIQRARQERLSQADRNNLFIAAHRRFIL
jgi:hypothetical protein